MTKFTSLLVFMLLAVLGMSAPAQNLDGLAVSISGNLLSDDAKEMQNIAAHCPGCTPDFGGFGTQGGVGDQVYPWAQIDFTLYQAKGICLPDGPACIEQYGCRIHVAKAAFRVNPGWKVEIYWNDGILILNSGESGEIDQDFETECGSSSMIFFLKFYTPTGNFTRQVNFTCGLCSDTLPYFDPDF